MESSSSSPDMKSRAFAQLMVEMSASFRNVIRVRVSSSTISITSLGCLLNFTSLDRCFWISSRRNSGAYNSNGVFALKKTSPTAPSDRSMVLNTMFASTTSFTKLVVCDVSSPCSHLLRGPICPPRPAVPSWLSSGPDNGGSRAHVAKRSAKCLHSR